MSLYRLFLIPIDIVQVKALQQQFEAISVQTKSMSGRIEQLERCIAGGDIASMKQAYDALMSLMQEPRVPTQPGETDELLFDRGDPALVEMAKSLGTLKTNANAESTFVIGERLLEL